MKACLQIHMKRLATMSLLVAGLLTASSGMVSQRAHADAHGEPLIIFAAASLTNVMGELATRFAAQQDHPTTVSFAATSVLARQIKDGAPAHVFISANTAWMDDVIADGAVLADSRTVIAGNRLVLAGAEDIAFPPVSEQGLVAGYPLADVAPNLPFAIANPDHVPAGLYARQALQNTGLWDGIKDRLIPMPDVRAVITNIDRGEVAGGFVYASDMRFAAHAKIIAPFPATMHAPIQYVAGIVQGRRTPAADSFIAFLLSSEAENVMMDFGLLPRPPTVSSTEPE